MGGVVVIRKSLFSFHLSCKAARAIVGARGVVGEDVVTFAMPRNDAGNSPWKISFVNFAIWPLAGTVIDRLMFSNVPDESLRSNVTITGASDGFAIATPLSIEPGIPAC